MRILHNLLSTIALVVIAAACGWFGTLAIRGLRAEPALQAGDYSAIVTTAGRPVVLFATTTCPYCAKARSLLDAMNVAHVEYDVDTSEPARALYEQLHANSVPVLVTANLRITGFDEQAYRVKLATFAQQTP
ncbi:glutaredoxin family protein [Dokdonella sp.]|uniref:glutaredoxin family protein n=1 Tax=Dokdonella sp. TaxID=2291710 RepID=UPI0037833077